MLELKSLYYKYTGLSRNAFALNQISLLVEPGYIYGLVGRNGAGKTTLMNCIAKISFTDGVMEMDGVDMVRNRLQVKQDMGIIMGEPLLLSECTALENGRIFGGFYRSWNEDRYLEALSRWKVNAYEPLNSLSRGEQMRVSLALMETVRPKYLLADEPSAGFDPTVRKEFLRFLQEYVEDGEHAVLFSTHITKELDQVADYINILDKGSIIYQGDLEQMRDAFSQKNGRRATIEMVMKELLGSGPDTDIAQILKETSI